MNRPSLASRHRGFGPSIFAEMTRLARLHDAVNLAQGFPDFAAPDFMKEAASAAIRADRNQYARMAGEPELVAAVAASLSARFGLDFDPMTEITVFCGATEAIHCALLSLCGPGDEVVMLEPFYDSYPACCTLAGATPRLVPLHPPNFRWDPSELAAAFGPRTRLALVNTPHNPSGRVLDRDELEALADLCRRHDAICVTDEVYERLVFDGPHLPMAMLPGMRERTVTISSIGKAFSVTGWKIGYASAPKPLSEALAAVHQFVTFAAATPFQHAAAAGLLAPPGYFEELTRSYRERRDFLIEVLSECGFTVYVPQGTYFILADIRSLGQGVAGWDDVGFCRRLVEEAGVAAVPASALYGDGEAGRRDGRRLVRFAFCKSRETLEEGARRLRAWRAR